MSFLATIQARKEDKVAEEFERVPNPLIYDAQGLYAKNVWRSVFEGERDSAGRRVWRDAASYLLTANAKQKAAPIDFACGTGTRASNARVKPCERRFQRLFGNKRHQYHLLEAVRPRVIPETHFSVASAVRSVASAGGAAASTRQQDRRGQSKGSSLWFAKEPTRQRGTGIAVIASGDLQAFGEKAKAADDAKPHIPDERVFQRSIADGDIACVDGRKADLRMYILVEPSEEQKVFLYKDAVVRVAPRAYAGNEDASLESQLTNVAQGGDIIRGSDWEPFCSSFQAIRKLVQRVVRHLAPWFQKGRCELLGVDIMLDGNGQPWLVELNGSPSIGGHGTPLLFRPEMLRELLRLAVYPQLRREYANNAAKLLVVPKENDACMELGWDLLFELGKGQDVAKVLALDKCVRFAWVCDEPHHEENSLMIAQSRDVGKRNTISAAATASVNSAKATSTTESYGRDAFTYKGQVGLLMHPDVAGDMEHVLCYRPSPCAAWQWDVPAAFKLAPVEKEKIDEGAFCQ